MIRHALLLLPCLLLVGCGAKLNFQNVCTLTIQTPENLNYFPEQSGEQTLTVKVSSTEPVDLGFYLASSSSDPRDLTPAERISKALLHKKAVKDESFTVKIPAKSAYSLMIYLPADGKKPANVTTSIKN